MVVFLQTCPNRFLKFRQTLWWVFNGKIHFSRFLVQTFSDVQQNLNRKIVKTSFYLFRKPVEETDLFELFNVFRTYSEFEQSFFWLLAESFHIKLSKLLSTCSGSTPGWKTTFFWQNLSGLTSELQTKLFLTIGKSSTHRLSKLFSPCLGNKVKKQIFHKLFGFYVYSDFKRNLFWLLEISLCEFVKTAFYEFRRTLWLKKLLRRIPILLRRVVIKMFSDFSQKVYIGVVETNFYKFKNSFEETDFFRKIYFVFGTY